MGGAEPDAVLSHFSADGDKVAQMVFFIYEQNTICASRDGSDRWESGQEPGRQPDKFWLENY